MQLKRVFVVLSLFVLPTSCRPLYLNTVDPTGPPEYQLGWEDGCDTSLGAEGEWYYKVMYGFKKRPEMAANDQYKQGWNEGFTFCRFSLAHSQQPGSFEDIGLGNGF